MCVSAISETSFPIDHMLLRSLLPRNQQMRVPDSNRRRRPGHELAALKLAGHLAVTSFLFLVLVIAIWITSSAFHSLHSVFPFSKELLRFLDRLELLLAYVDGALICSTLLIGSCHYILSILRGHS
jgi:hypothetical protein